MAGAPSLVAKFCDQLPPYRQSGIYARGGAELERSTPADWAGQAAAMMRPLVDAPVLAPGTGRTSTGRLWAMLRDERPCAGPAPPAVPTHYSPDRHGEHPRTHLAGFGGVLQADGHAGFGSLHEGGGALAAACRAHARRKFHDIHAAGTSALARERWRASPPSTPSRPGSAASRPGDGQAPVPRQRHEEPDILPVDVCAFPISH